MGRFVDNLNQMDKVKLTRIVIYGLILAVLGLTIIMVSRSIAQGAVDWLTLQTQENDMNFWNNMYGFNEYTRRAQENTQTYNWMIYQGSIFSAVGRIAFNIGLLLAIIGLFAFSINQSIDDKTKLVCLVTACALLFLMVFSTLFMTSEFTITYT